MKWLVNKIIVLIYNYSDEKIRAGTVWHAIDRFRKCRILSLGGIELQNFGKQRVEIISGFCGGVVRINSVQLDANF